MFYKTSKDAIDQAILPALGDWVNDFDIDGIFEEVFAWDIEEQAFYQKVDAPEFWKIVQAHDLKKMRLW